MTKCPSCGAAMNPQTHTCNYCGTAGEQAMNRPKPISPEEMEQQLRQAQDIVNKLMPAPMRWIGFIVPIIALLVTVFIIVSMLRS